MTADDDQLMARGEPVRLAADRRHSADTVREAALTLFSEYGFQRTTMNDIGRALGIRAPSLYNHLSSKDALLEELMYDSVREMADSWTEATSRARGPLEVMESGYESYVRYHCRRRREAFLVNREMRSLPESTRSQVQVLRDEFYGRFESTVEEGVAGGVFSVPSARTAVEAILAMGRGVATWYRQGGGIPEDDVARHYVEYALRVLGAHRGRAAAPDSKVALARRR